MSNQDYVWGIALILSGIFITFCALRYGLNNLVEKNVVAFDWKAGRWYQILMKNVVPLLAIFLLVWWLSLSVTLYETGDWVNPFLPYSLMTCLVQWGLVMVILGMLNKVLVKYTIKL